jgi:hypothetical protein
MTYQIRLLFFTGNLNGIFIWSYGTTNRYMRHDNEIVHSTLLDAVQIL